MPTAAIIATGMFSAFPPVARTSIVGFSCVTIAPLFVQTYTARSKTLHAAGTLSIIAIAPPSITWPCFSFRDCTSDGMYISCRGPIMSASWYEAVFAVVPDVQAPPAGCASAEPASAERPRAAR